MWYILMICGYLQIDAIEWLILVLEYVDMWYDIGSNIGSVIDIELKYIGIDCIWWHWT